MSIQIAVRLPNALVSYLDESVAQGKAKSRAELVAAAIEREMRHRAAVRDAEILQSTGPADDLDSLVEWTAHQLIED